MAIFRVQEHTIPTCHIREYPRALADDQEDVLQLAIKQYTPNEKADPANIEVTIIGAHANGFPKELYEPLWDDLFLRLKSKGIYIQSIWIADVAHEGQSGILNEEKLGNDPSWLDHPRDLFLMVNHFRKYMKRPLIGIGHSMGGNNLVNLALMHPRLLTSLILIDPVLQRMPSPQGNFGPAKASVTRREIWPSRQAAREKLKQSKFYQAWDSRVLDRWIKYGLRDLPTYIHPQTTTSSTPLVITADPSTATVPPSDSEKPVTLTTTKHQEVLTFLRPNFPTPEWPNPDIESNPLTHPDADPSAAPNAPFYSPVPNLTFHKIQHLRPSVFYIFGDAAAGAFLSEPLLKADKLANTGIGVGGSGGVKKGRVTSVSFPDVGHLIPMEVVDETAKAAAGWLGPELKRWKDMEDQEARLWKAVPKKQRAMLNEEYVTVMNTDWMEQAAARISKVSKL